jgi:hypothetical protein
MPAQQKYQEIPELHKLRGHDHITTEVTFLKRKVTCLVINNVLLQVRKKGNSLTLYLQACSV